MMGAVNEANAINRPVGTVIVGALFVLAAPLNFFLGVLGAIGGAAGVGLFLAGVSIACAITGIGLLARARWARVAAILLCAIAVCLNGVLVYRYWTRYESLFYGALESAFVCILLYLILFRTKLATERSNRSK